MYRNDKLSANEIQYAITNDYPNMCAIVDLDQVGPRQNTVNRITVSRLLTEFLTPAALLMQDGRCLNPILGVQSESMEYALGLSGTESRARLLSGESRYQCGEPHFLFGQLNAGISDGASTASFSVLDHPDNAGLIKHVMAIYKIYNQDSPHTKRPWQAHQEVEGSFIEWWSATTDTFDGVYWKLMILPIGFRFVEKEEFFWIEDGRKFRVYDDFVGARQEMMRNLCKKLLQARETGEQNPDELPEATAPDIRAAPKPEGAVLSTAELKSLPPEAFCEAINKRLDVLRGHKDLSGIESYVNETKFCSREYFVQKKSGTKHTRLQALHYLARMEHLAKMYQKYSEYFVKLESQIDEIEGLLSVENIHFAEIEVATDQPFGPNEKATRVLRFSYSPQGVIAARKWLVTEKEHYSECSNQLELTDNTTATDN